MNLPWWLLCYYSLLAFLRSTGESLPYTLTQSAGAQSGKALSSRAPSGQTLSGISGPQRQVSGIDRFLSEHPRNLRRFDGEKDGVGLMKNSRDVRNMTLSDVRNMTLSDEWNMTLIDVRNMTLRDARDKQSIEQRILTNISAMSPSNLLTFDNQTIEGVPVEKDLVGSEPAAPVPIGVHDDLSMADQRSEYVCHVTRDLVYNGSLVDCTHRGIHDVSKVKFPENTTTLILDRNNISVLRNESFVQLTWLRHLSVRSANVSHMEVDALAGLPLLDILNLEANTLPIAACAFPFHMFRHVPNLRTLLIGYNSKVKGTWVGESQQTPRASPKRMCGGASEKSQYQSHIDIFEDLPKLETLSIDSFKTLYLGSEFSKFQT